MTGRAVAALLGVEPVRLDPVYGGDINQAYRAELADGRTVFVKRNPDAPHGMFEAEARGLAWLGEARAVAVPAVIAHDHGTLVLEWLAPGRPPRDARARLGRDLARLHRHGAPGFGLDQPSFIATLPQDNQVCARWDEHWFAHRLAPMAERAIAAGRGPSRWRRDLDQLAARADRLAPDQPAARLHGDLWHGNVHMTAAGAVLIDPAVYGGPREVDLAMLALFGGLDEQVMSAYHAEWPLPPGFDERVPLWQLYPLLVHVVLFGGSYAASVDRAVAALR